VDLRAGLDDLEKRKYLTLPGLELRPLGRPAHSFFFRLLVGDGVHMEVHAALRPVIGLLYLSRVIVRMEKFEE
jgi:hypothetical protein